MNACVFIWLKDIPDRITNTTSPPTAASVNELIILGVSLTPTDGRTLPSLGEVNSRIEISPRGEEYVVLKAFDFVSKPIVYM